MSNRIVCLWIIWSCIFFVCDILVILVLIIFGTDVNVKLSNLVLIKSGGYDIVIIFFIFLLIFCKEGWIVWINYNNLSSGIGDRE